MIESRDAVQSLKTIFSNLERHDFVLVALVFLLQFINWGIEAFKFKRILIKKERISFKQAITAVYIGNASSIFTPDRLGNFIGRAFYLRTINNIVITSSTMLGNLAQLFSTLIFAFIGMLLFVSTNHSITAIYSYPEYILALVFLLNLIVGGVYFYPRIYIYAVLRIKKLKKYRPNFIFIAKYTTTELALFLGLSLVRYLVFVIQFYILLAVFGIQLEVIELFIFIGLMYFVTTLIPSPILGNLGTRELTAIYLLSTYNHPEAVLVASLVIWIINVIFPAVLGFVLAFNMNLYQKDL